MSEQKSMSLRNHQAHTRMEEFLPPMSELFLTESSEMLFEGEMGAYFKGILGTIIGLPVAVKIINWMGSTQTTDEASMITLMAMVGIPTLTGIFVLLKKILGRCSSSEISQLRDRRSFEKILANKIKPEEKAKVETILEPIA